MRTVLSGLCAGLLVLTLVTPARPASSPGLSVARASVRFGRGGGDSPVHAAVRLEGDFTSSLADGSYDPVRDGFRVRVGGTRVLDAADPEAKVRARRGAGGAWTGKVRAADGSRARFRLFPASGIFDLRAAGLDGSALLDAGSLVVAVQVAAGEEEHGAWLEFREAGPRAWTWEASVEGRLPPPSPPPGDPTFPPDWIGTSEPMSLFPIAKGVSSGIRSEFKRVVRTAGEWSDIWRQHAPGVPVPPVDFDQKIALVYVGGIECISDTVEIYSAERIGPSIVVHAGPGNPYGGVKDSPYHFVSIHRYELPVYFSSY